jgi:hypothetical protein
MNLLQLTITEGEGSQIAEILERRANEIAVYQMEHRAMPGRQTGTAQASVDYALELEMMRLRRLAGLVKPRESGWQIAPNAEL